MYNYKFIEHTADIAVELTASSLEELFICASEAWIHSMVSELDFSGNEKIDLKLRAQSTEELLVEYLSEINFLFLTKKWFCTSVEDLSIESSLIEGNEVFSVLTTINGRDISKSEIEFQEEIKAVTYHQLKIEKKNNSFFTRIVFDI